MKKLFLVLAAAVLMAAPAFAAVQNVKVSGDIDSTYLNRQNFDLGYKNGSGIKEGLASQSVFFTQTRLRVDADLSDNVSTTVRLLNERAWGASSTSSIDLNLAYVTMREFLYSPLTMTIGLQELSFGNGLVVGNGTNNATTGTMASIAADLGKNTAFDGIKAVLDYKPLTIDLVYAKLVGNHTSGALVNGDVNKTDSNLYGINANYQLGDSMNTVVEGYFWAKKDGNSPSFSTTNKMNEVFVPGLRVSTNPIKGLNTQAEIAWQKGRVGNGNGLAGTSANRTREAMAAQLLASYAIPVAQLEKYKPVVSGSYTYVSGAKNVGGADTGKTYKGWDPMFEGQGSGTIYNTLFNLTNLNIFNVGLQVNPIQDVTASISWSDLFLANKTADLNLIQPDGSSSSVASAVTTNKKSLGNEIDMNVNYNYTEDVLFGVNLGWFIPGNTFAKSNNSVASQAVAHVNVNF
ncbi:MAG: alginate export family protein [Candidatus Omnitrophota bacterium]